MVTKLTKRRQKEEEHTYLSIEVNGIDVSSGASLNPVLRLGRMPFSQTNDPAFEFATTLKIRGVCTSPDDRSGEIYNLTVLGRELHAGDHSATLEDFQVRDEYGVPQYRSYRGEHIPVYAPPPGIGRLQRDRGSKSWDAWFWFRPGLVSDMLTLLSGAKPLYVSLHERKSGRDRWVQSFSLQTTRPDEE